MTNLLAKKPLDRLINEAKETGEHSLKRTLGVFQLTALDQRYLKDPLGKITTKVIDEIWLTFDELVGRK